MIAALLIACTTTDEMSYLDNGRVRVGINLSLGGAITHLSQGKKGPNLINSYDWGRQIQMSFYSGPNPFAPNGKKPLEAWASLGWNPIQSGDANGNRSRILKHRNTGKSLYVKCIPMQWPLDNEPGECTFESWITLEGNTVQVRSRINNQRSDRTVYGARDQELPAVYTNAPWNRIVTYTGDRPFTNDKVADIPATFPWSRWQATESWAALLDSKGEGLGIWHPGVTTFIGGFAGEPDVGGEKDFPTGYLSPIHVEQLDWNIVYEYQYTLILGDLKEIRDTVYRLNPNGILPRYMFAADRQHWRFSNATDGGWPIKKSLNLTATSDDIQMTSPSLLWRTESGKTLVLEAAITTGGTEGRVFWSRFDAPGFAGERSLAFPIQGDGTFRRYRISLRQSPEFKGAITGLRIDPIEGSRAGDTVKVRGIWIEP